jgi:dihydrofolate synthase/folylpolyglutamate synthase
MMKDKDIDGFLRGLAPSASTLIATKADSERAVKPEDILRYAEGTFTNHLKSDSVEEAIALARDTAGNDGIVLITGSFYVAGEARQMYKPVHHKL